MLDLGVGDHRHDDEATTSPTTTVVSMRPLGDVDLRVDYAAGCATAPRSPSSAGRGGAAGTGSSTTLRWPGGVTTLAVESRWGGSTGFAVGR